MSVFSDSLLQDIEDIHELERAKNRRHGAMEPHFDTSFYSEYAGQEHGVSSMISML